LLVRDGGVPGVVVRLGRDFAGIEAADGRVSAGAMALDVNVARVAAEAGLAGLEFLVGIPGTIGGALAMNAGCYGAETWDIVAAVTTIDRAGEIRRRTKADYELGYRHCRLKAAGEEWFLEGAFSLAPGEAAGASARIKELLARRIATQPLSLPNAGSVFRNPPGDHAARLIESCGLKGFGRGGARVSEKHANFIVNPKGAASAADIEWLIEEVRRKVAERHGIELVPEVRIVGEAP
ncbi:MAG TPA: UDP-N-acetylmuramate dehydrogenase, partial [Burkholderiales bacterium]|nr:UDP-N-acetylmuramate dehydrogenase [Burkholderiales bacterium]